MKTSLIQTRVETELKNEAAELFDNLGLDMSTAIKMFLKKCLQEGGLPFDIKLTRKNYKNPEGMRAFLALREEAEANDLLGMGLDEINDEIRAVRAERRAKQGG